MRLVLCDDNRISCEALAVALEARGHQALAIATTTDEGLAAVARHAPDACLLDLSFNTGGDGLGVARAIRDQYPGTAVLVVSGLSDSAASLVDLQAGGPGWPGDSRELDRIAAVLDVFAAHPPADPRPVDPHPALTPREKEVLQRIAAGQNTKTMAREMKVTTETVRTYVKKVLIKLGAHSRLEAASLVSRPLSANDPQPDRDHPMFAGLTPREREILVHLTKGSGQREVAKQLHMSLKTVNTHLHHLRSKLGVHSTLEVVALGRAKLGQRPAAKEPGLKSPEWP